MIFSLEALQAFHGDSLLLHAGSAAEPVLLLIDGGPSGTWERSLQPRLEELRAERAGDGALQVDLAMVSHIDSDHVAGMVDFAGELVTEQQDSKPLRYEVGTLWHNSFDDVLGNDAEDLRVAAVDILSAPVADRVADEIRAAGLAVVASVAEGRELRDQAQTLGWSVNEPFDGPVVLPKEGVRKITLGPLSLTVVCPHAEQLEKLHAAWDKWLKGHPKAVANPATAAASRDNSPYNLSSIVVLAGSTARACCSPATRVTIMSSRDSRRPASPRTARPTSISSSCPTTARFATCARSSSHASPPITTSSPPTVATATRRPTR